MANIRETTDRATGFFKTNAKTILTNVSVVVLAVFFVFYNTLKLAWTNLNPWILLIRSILAIVVGIMIKTALGENGFDRGYRSDTWNNEFKRYELKADEAVIYIDKVDNFYEKQKKEKMMKNRKTRLSGYRMKYEMFFDDNGDYIEHEIWSPHQKKKYFKNPYDDNVELPDNVVVLDLRQKWCLRKCIKLKIYIKNMFSDYEVGLTADEKKEKTDKAQRTHNLRKNTFKTVAFSLAGVYLAATLVWDWGSVINAVFQVLGFIFVGLLDSSNNFYYVTVEKVNILREKQSDISKFLIEQIGRESFKEKFIEQPKEQPQPQEKIIELTQEQADAFLKNVAYDPLKEQSTTE